MGKSTDGSIMRDSRTGNWVKYIDGSEKVDVCPDKVIREETTET